MTYSIPIIFQDNKTPDANSSAIDNHGGYDLNYLLKIINIILFTSCAFIHVFVGNTHYINQISIIILFIIAMESHLFLIYEEKKSNPFIIILVANSILFYFSRIFTLLISDYSTTLTRHSLNADDFNKTLLFIIFANASLFLGLIGFSTKRLSNMRISDYKYKSSFFVISVLIGLIFINHHILYLPSFRCIKGYVGFYLANMEYIILIVSVYLILFYRSLGLYSKTIISFIIMLYAFILALFGSRSGLLMISSLVMCALLAVRGRLIIKKSALFVLVALSVGSMYLFAFATSIRDMPKPPGYYQFGSFSYDRFSYILHYIPAVDSAIFKNQISRIFDRIGFLDNSVDLIKSDTLYSRIINLKYYAKSIIDNGLTPGFDVFDTPKAANALRHIYTNKPGFPVLADVADAYHADMFTIYGEFYILFWEYWSLFFLFLFAFITKAIYSLGNFDDPFFSHVYKAGILVLFYHELNSFGLDWLVFDIIGISIAVLIFGTLFQGKYIKAQEDFLVPC